MLLVLRHCIPKYFTVELLNHFIELFYYGDCDSSKIPSISLDFASRDKLKMSGPETLMFVRMFGLLVSDRVPHDDPFWIFLNLKLSQLLDKCLSKSISPRMSVSLRILVEEFNEIYVCVPNDTLKPKFHFQVHYSTIIDESGPVALTSTKRFESKHRSLLMRAHDTQSRMQICVTVAIHHQLQMCFRCKSRSRIIPKPEFGPLHEVSWANFSNPECLKSVLATPMSSCMSANWVKLKGTKYKLRMVLTLQIDNSENPVFGHIEAIILESNNSFVLVFSHLMNLGFDSHVHGYEVESSDSWSKVYVMNLFDPLPHNINLSASESKKFVVLHCELSAHNLNFKLISVSVI
ncbi:uncharacterized protein LOC127749479 [Frankliniella occidentalis]|uniref:Uncharacterized protein LOC127749479 n=1 Tax=Frankliniella occidentalis TaxID=133901 RepID=A0A9C6TWJ8_FRAOC|nr:uncharacterized protein LOC127749479 [Frankliniella occidentalis]